MSQNETLQEQKRFSIIIAAYNIENYIARAIESVEKQTFQNKELIVVDDCSTDNTPQKILDLTKQYPHIQFIQHETNKKAGGARNTGLSVAKRRVYSFLRWR